MNYSNVHIAETSMIAPSACLIGNVALGEETVVMHCASARGDYGGRIEIGDRTNMQENVCIHVNRQGLCKIGSDVTIGHGAILHGCTIGDETLVGMGAIILDGAAVGNKCLIGAGALVTGTANIPDGMLVVGSPARAARALSPEEIQRVFEGADEYVVLAREMTEQGLLYSGTATVTANCPQVKLA